MYNATNSAGSAGVRKVTVPELLARKRTLGAPPIAMVTAYDFTMARLIDEGGADMILVGDSLGMVVQGLANTIPVTLDEICYHGRAVARGTTRAHITGDMPFMTYQVSPTQAVESAGKLFKDRKHLVLTDTLGHVLASCVRPANAADGPAVIVFWDEAADQMQSM